MYQDIRLFLNETDITDQVVFRQRDLDIRQKFRDYRATIGLVIPSTSTISIKPSNEVKVKYTNTNNETKTLFGGIIFNLEYGEMTSDGSIEVMLDCEGFYPSLAGRRTITNVLTQELNPPIGVTEADWMYYAGYLAASYVDKFLSQDGVSVGHVEAGRLLAATELEEFVTMSIKEIYDVLAEPSGHSWWIDNDKVFHFGALLDFITYSAAEDTVSIGNGNFTVKGCSLDLSGFINKVFIEGSDDWDAEVPPEHQDIYGRILYIKENTASINKLSLLNGNTGVFGSVLRDGNIMNLETAQYRADKILSLYPDIPYQLRVDTFDDRFKPGDKLPVNLPFYGINNELFTIHDINIEMATGKKPIFHMVLSNVPELGGTENLYQYFDQIGQRITPSNQTPITYPTEPTTPTIPDEYTDASYFTFDPGTKAITAYSDFGPKQVVIPPQIDGVDVRKIDYDSFKSMYITSVKFPYTLTEISNNAFYGNKLTSVTLPDSLVILGGGAFAMNYITSATLGNSLSMIGVAAFHHNKLNRIVIPKSVTLIQDYAFDNNGINGVSGSLPVEGPWRGIWAIVNDVWTKDDSMYSPLSWFTFDELTGAITRISPISNADIVIPPSINGVDVVSVNSGTTIYPIDSVVIPDTVTDIPYRGFFDRDIKTLLLGNNIRKIGKQAFYRNNMSSLIIPDSVTEIGDEAFNYCFLLTSAKLSNNLISIGNSAFHDNRLSEITIPNSVTSIGTSAFRDNLLKKVTLGENVYVIDISAFSYNQIEEIIITDNVNTIRNGAFETNKLKTAIIPESVTAIGDYAFRANPDIEFTVSPTNPSYSSINGALYSKDGSTLITGGKSGIIAAGTLAIKDYAFNGYGLESVIIPDGVTLIGALAFINNKLTQITLPDSLITIGSVAFNNNGPDGNISTFPSTPPADGWGGTWILDGATWIKQS